MMEGIILWCANLFCSLHGGVLPRQWGKDPSSKESVVKPTNQLFDSLQLCIVGYLQPRKWIVDWAICSNNTYLYSSTVKGSKPMELLPPPYSSRKMITSSMNIGIDLTQPRQWLEGPSYHLADRSPLVAIH